MLRSNYLLFFLCLVASSLVACENPELGLGEVAPDNLAPTVTMVSPEEGDRLTLGIAVEVAVTAHDSDGRVSELVLTRDGEELERVVGDESELSLVTTFSPARSGRAVLRAVARDDSGDTAEALVEVEVVAGDDNPGDGGGDGDGSGLSEPFTFVAVPDTQNMIKRSDNTMTSEMTGWIADNAAELDVAFVSQLGDVVYYGDRLDEWERADEAFDLLDGVVPYGVGFGDHEYEYEEDMGSSVANYIDYFGPDRYQAYDWYGGADPSGKNHYQYFEAGGQRFMHLALEWEAPGPASDPATPLGWARQLLEDNSDVPTIISTHAYIWDTPGEEGRTWKPSHLEGFIEQDDGSEIYPGSTGEEIFEALVKPFPQVFMVLSAHYHNAEGTDDGEFHQVSTNDAGLEVYEMLSNFQDYPNGGNGWLRLIEFTPGAGEGELDRIDVHTYSPVLDEVQTDGRSRFHFDLDFEERFSLP